MSQWYDRRLLWQTWEGNSGLPKPLTVEKPKTYPPVRSSARTRRSLSKNVKAEARSPKGCAHQFSFRYSALPSIPAMIQSAPLLRHHSASSACLRATASSAMAAVAPRAIIVPRAAQSDFLTTISVFEHHQLRAFLRLRLRTQAFHQISWWCAGRTTAGGCLFPVENSLASVPSQAGQNDPKRDGLRSDRIEDIMSGLEEITRGSLTH
jgi:hypothetical protein